MTKNYILILLIFISYQANALSKCVEITDEDSDDAKTVKNRNCRIYYNKLKYSVSEESEEELSNVLKIMKANDGSFSNETDKSITKIEKNSKKNKKLISKNKDLIEDNKEIIKKNEKLLNAVDKDLASLEGAFGGFTKYQDAVNDLNSKAITQNLGDIADIFKDLSKKQKEISKNQLHIDRNRSLINSNMISSLEYLAIERKARTEQLKSLEKSLKDEISKKLGSVCSSLKYCGAANANVSSAKKGAGINYNKNSDVDNSNRAEKSIIDSLGITNIGEKPTSTLQQ